MGRSNRDKDKLKARRRARKTVKRRPLSPKALRLFRLEMVAIGVAILLTVGGFSFAATQEQNDSFCASCHTQPESTFYQRSLTATPVDLASAHKPDNTRCIDCHSGPGVFGRINAELLGAHNALAYFTHTDVQPARLTVPIGDGNCLKCHQATLTPATINVNNHFHAFLPRWQAADSNAARCVSCHNGHLTGGDVQLAYINDSTTQSVCAACHQVLGGGG